MSLKLWLQSSSNGMVHAEMEIESNAVEEKTTAVDTNGSNGTDLINHSPAKVAGGAGAAASPVSTYSSFPLPLSSSMSSPIKQSPRSSPAPSPPFHTGEKRKLSEEVLLEEKKEGERRTSLAPASPPLSDAVHVPSSINGPVSEDFFGSVENVVDERAVEGEKEEKMLLVPDWPSGEEMEVVSRRAPDLARVLSELPAASFRLLDDREPASFSSSASSRWKRPSHFIIQSLDDYKRNDCYEATSDDEAWLSTTAPLESSTIPEALSLSSSSSFLSLNQLESCFTALEEAWLERYLSASAPLDPSVGLFNSPDDGPQDDWCAICLSGVVSECDQIVYCDRCAVACHQSCYGVNRVPNGAWLCQRCAHEVLREEEVDDEGIAAQKKKRKQSEKRRDSEQCALCKLRVKDDKLPQAWVKTTCGHWAHVLCGHYIPGAKFIQESVLLAPSTIIKIRVPAVRGRKRKSGKGAEEKREPVDETLLRNNESLIKGTDVDDQQHDDNADNHSIAPLGLLDISNVVRERFRLMCKICQKRGACVQCAWKTCTTGFHVICAISDHVDVPIFSDFIEEAESMAKKRRAAKNGGDATNGDADASEKDAQLSPLSPLSAESKRLQAILDTTSVFCHRHHQRDRLSDEARARFESQVRHFAERAELLASVKPLLTESDASDLLSEMFPEIPSFLHGSILLRWKKTRELNGGRPLLLKLAESAAVKASALRAAADGSLEDCIVEINGLRVHLERAQALLVLTRRREKLKRSRVESAQRAISLLCHWAGNADSDVSSLQNLFDRFMDRVQQCDPSAIFIAASTPLSHDDSASQKMTRNLLDIQAKIQSRFYECAVCRSLASHQEEHTQKLRPVEAAVESSKARCAANHIISAGIEEWNESVSALQSDIKQWLVVCEALASSLTEHDGEDLTTTFSLIQSLVEQFKNCDFSDFDALENREKQENQEEEEEGAEEGEDEEDDDEAEEEIIEIQPKHVERERGGIEFYFHKKTKDDEPIRNVEVSESDDDFKDVGVFDDEEQSDDDFNAFDIDGDDEDDDDNDD